ncbi:hypothetical protein [Pedobacter nanyangensis]|uniref:hypothetical protein n=1 Tax=Pedobacter nanyangensis TaxID=1562389 RepID=UPI000DE34852|nr:hypothetical protein [Pedobacter nanyangensis]
MSKKTKTTSIAVSNDILKTENRQMAVAKGLLETGSDNWLQVKKSSNSAIISIPKYCRVSNVSFSGTGTNKREVFTIVDWPYVNEVCSVAALPDSRSRFGNVDYNVGSIVTYDHKAKTLTVNPGGITVKAGIDPNNPMSNGEYLLRLPDAPHIYGRPYLDRTSFALTWFFIEDTDHLDRYLHTGSVSEGCVTVGLNGGEADFVKWTDIAKILSTQRLASNNAFVGKLVVKGY